MKLSAAIFDLDGTILNDEDEYAEAFRKVLSRLGIEEKENFPHITGIGLSKNWEILIEKYSLTTDKNLDVLAAETQEEYLKLFDRVTLKRGFLDFIEMLKDGEIVTALCTSNSWGVVEKVFDKFVLGGEFDVVTTGEEVKENKPAPDIFLITAEKLMVPSTECVVFEDSKAGIDSAKKAGMVTVGVFRDKKHKEKLDGARLLIDDFESINYKNVRSL